MVFYGGLAWEEAFIGLGGRCAAWKKVILDINVDVAPHLINISDAFPS